MPSSCMKFKSRRMNGVAAKIAQEILVFFKDINVHARSGE